MSRAIQRNDIFQLDGYRWNRRREPDKPLITQLAEDLMDNGFVDVGPEVVKITVSDAALTRYIDNIIVYYYDSNTNIVNEGAHGLRNVTSEGYDGTFTEWKMDNNDLKIKNIQDDPYTGFSGSDHWADYLSLTLPGSKTNTFKTQYPGEDATYFDKFLGPNAELFSYLNPNPQNQDADGNWLKKLPNVPTRKKKSDEQTGYFGLSFISERVYRNEFAKIKRLITTSARYVVAYPDVASGIESKGNLRNYVEELEPSGVINHHFWFTTYKDEQFFPADVTEPSRWEGFIGLSSEPGVLQYGDTYEFTLTSTSQKTSASIPTINSVTVDSDEVAPFLEKVYNSFVNSAIANPLSGYLTLNVDPTRIGIMEGYANQNSVEQTMTVSRIPYTKQYGATPTAGFPSGSNQSFTGLTDPKIASHSTVTYNDGYNLNYANYQLDGLGLLTSGWAYNENMGQTSSWRSPTTNPRIDVFKQGYVHKHTIAGFDGADPGDIFDVKLKGLVDESGDKPWEADPIDIEVSFTASVPMTALALTTAIANEMKLDPYISEYMVIKTGTNYIDVEYKETSSAYLRRSKKRTATDDKGWGLFNAKSSVYQAAVNAGHFTSGTYATINHNWWNMINLTGLALSFRKSWFAWIENTTDAQISNSFATDETRFGTGGLFPSTGTLDTTTEQGSIKYVSPYPASFGAHVNYTDGLFETDVPDLAKFSSEVTYNENTLVASDPLTFNFQTTQEPAVSNVGNIRLSFPLARDMGTFANPVNNIGWEVFPAIKGNSNASNYTYSYYQQILSDSSADVKTERPTGPEISFDYDKRYKHPNQTHGSLDLGLTPASDFQYNTSNLDIDSFEYVRDYSMGPIVLETSASSPLSGSGGDQAWRIRLNVSRGYEIKDASPYINEVHIELGNNSVDPRLVSDRQFEYLQLHIATKYQLLSNGDVTETQGVDVTKPAKIREPGFLGALRPQYSGYVQSNVHLINPYVLRAQLDDAVESEININAGRVGISMDAIEGVDTSGLADIFQNNTSGSGVSDITYETRGDAANPVVVTRGLLEDGEFRYEEQYLTGSSTELIYDTPYNTGNMRIQKGFFRRSGKQFSDVAPSYPMSYFLTIADHGIVFAVRDQASSSESDDNAWVVVQRHVDSVTGEPDFTSNTQPVHCIYQTSEPPVLWSDYGIYFTNRTIDERQSSLSYQGLYDRAGNYVTDFFVNPVIADELAAYDMEGQGRFRRFVVREKDTLKPWDRHVFAGINEIDSHSVINPLEQLSLNDDGQLVIQFPNRIGSQRYLFTGKELDLIAFCDGGSVGQDTLVSSDRFSDTGLTNKTRTYKGMMSTKSYGNGMRVLLLTDGWGVDNSYLSS